MKDCKQQWWKDARFGMFIHWGLYSSLAGEWKGTKCPGVAEWILKTLQIPLEEYTELAKSFNPVDFNAEEWVKLAYETDMKYIVITAKHHDGFAMFKSDCSSYNIVDATPFKRDPMAEMAAACKKYDIKLCFYYSQVQDWHDENGFGYGRPDSEKDFSKYLYSKCLPQLTELLTKYGDIGLIWFDTPLNCEEKYSKIMYDHVKSLQPNCIVSGRIGNQLGEYMTTGDNMLPLLPFAGDWEVPATLNDTWGFKADDHNWKSAKDLIRLLVKINSRGGNYLLNVGPDAKGIIPQPSIDILREVGAFMAKNSESIYETQPAPLYPYEIPGGFFTSRPHKLYFHLFEPRETLYLTLLANNIKRVYLLETGEEIEFQNVLARALNIHRFTAKLPKPLPNDIDTVICFELEEETAIFDSLDNL